MLNLNEFAQRVHENAKKHGFWESNITGGELVAWLHSELSEAYEEYRLNHPKVWYSCADSNAAKPEGSAVELTDVCLLILDYIGAVGIHMDNCSSIRNMIDLLSDECRQAIQNMPFPDFIAQMHMEVSAAYQQNSPEVFVHALLPTQAMIFYWIETEGLDPEAILLEKFHYNENRPYKHGR